jgi:hypothetical protein
MEYVHIKNIDEYNPGYKDRQHIWAKIYWKIFIDESYQELCEIDRHRLIGLIVFETYIQKPVALTNINLTLLGWDIKKRPISLTIQMLHKFVEVRNENVTQSRVEESRIDKNRIDKTLYKEFVYLTDEEHQKLIDNFGQKQADDFITRLNNYIGSKGTKYKSHYHTILNWVEKETPKKKETIIL